ncbi:PREDICTED: GATA transcription factor 19-like [Tarenaya hassleriana]|uniref:GATA transcription factor 19-like n=1 Tax=Tarenaya hassleriana TaxID=28532 RepID=UPI00053C762A|nr:PREDICTED: GATA transcription factor 19-like [Tarenaya hassleriana]
MGRFSTSSYQEKNPRFFALFPPENDAVFAPCSSSCSPVDCTLSLATPSSTPLIRQEDKHLFGSSATSSGMIGWDDCKTASYLSDHQPPRSVIRDGDTLLSRRCSNCDTTSTPLWRNGPKGPKSLCNACGIRFKKEERRATAGKSNSGEGSSAAEAGVRNQTYNGGPNYSYNHCYDSSSTWHHQTTQRVPCSYYSPSTSEYTFIDDVRDGDSDVTAAPFLSWRLNVADQLY